MSDDTTAHPPDTAPTIGEHTPGGLLAVGTEVQVAYGHDGDFIAGTIVSTGATPAAYIVIDQRHERGKRLLFCSTIDYIEHLFPHPATS